MACIPSTCRIPHPRSRSCLCSSQSWKNDVGAHLGWRPARSMPGGETTVLETEEKRKRTGGEESLCLLLFTSTFRWFRLSAPINILFQPYNRRGSATRISFKATEWWYAIRVCAQTIEMTSSTCSHLLGEDEKKRKPDGDGRGVSPYRSRLVIT